MENWPAWTGWALPVLGWIGSTLFGGFVVNFFAQRKHRTEQVWNKQLEAYSIITAAIDNARRKAEILAEEDQMHPYGSPDSEWARKVSDQMAAEYALARETTLRNRLVLSAPFLKLMDQLEQDVAYDEDEFPGDTTTRLMRAYQKAHPALVAAAKADLKT